MAALCWRYAPHTERHTAWQSGTRSVGLGWRCCARSAVFLGYVTSLCTRTNRGRAPHQARSQPPANRMFLWPSCSRGHLEITRLIQSIGVPSRMQASSASYFHQRLSNLTDAMLPSPAIPPSIKIGCFNSTSKMYCLNPVYPP